MILNLGLRVQRLAPIGTLSGATAGLTKALAQWILKMKVFAHIFAFFSPLKTRWIWMNPSLPAMPRIRVLQREWINHKCRRAISMINYSKMCSIAESMKLFRGTSRLGTKQASTTWTTVRLTTSTSSWRTGSNISSKSNKSWLSDCHVWRKHRARAATWEVRESAWRTTTT